MSLTHERERAQGLHSARTPGVLGGREAKKNSGQVRNSFPCTLSYTGELGG